MDIPKNFTISESAHRIHNPFTAQKYATLGQVLRMAPGTRILDLGSGSGEMLCTWARDHGISGVGIDMSQLFSEQATLRASELGVTEHVCVLFMPMQQVISPKKNSILPPALVQPGLPAALPERSNSWNKVSNQAGCCSSANRTGARYPQRRRSLSLAARPQ